MAEKTIIDEAGQLVITVTPASTIITMTRKEIFGKQAEAQTVVDHKTIDLAVAVVERDKWGNYLIEMDKAL